MLSEVSCCCWLLASYQKLCTTLYKRTRRESLFEGHTCHSYLALALYENAPNKCSIWCQADKSRKPIFFAPKYKYPDRQIHHGDELLQLRVRRGRRGGSQLEERIRWLGMQSNVAFFDRSFNFESSSLRAPSSRRRGTHYIHSHSPSLRRRKHIAISISHRNTLQPSTPTPWLGEVAGQTTPRW